MKEYRYFKYIFCNEHTYYRLYNTTLEHYDSSKRIWLFSAFNSFENINNWLEKHKDFIEITKEEVFSELL